MVRLDSGAPIACSLNDADFRERRAFAREKLIPKIRSSRRIENGVEFHFDPEDKLGANLNAFVQLERQCCGFLTFTTLPEGEDSATPIGLRIEGPPEATATIETFAQAIVPEQASASIADNNQSCCSSSVCFTQGSSQGPCPVADIQ